MASDKSRAQSEMLQFFRGGKAMREDLVRRCLRDLQEKKKARFQERSAAAMQAAKYLSEVQKAANSASDPQTAKALEGLLGIHKKLTKHKLALPKFLPGPGGIVAGRISVTRTPPYDYSDGGASADQGYEPVLTGSAVKTTGQLSASAVTSDLPAWQGGSWLSTVGIYYHPMAPGSLTVSVNPIYSFESWTESFFPGAAVQSNLEAWLSVDGYILDPVPVNMGGPTEMFLQSYQQQPGPLVLKDGFNLQASASVSWPVDPSQVYLISVSVDAGVLRSVNSIAGAILSMTVPSITYDFEMQPINA